jgi:Zn-dependent alcohol dehydrogenase
VEDVGADVSNVKRGDFVIAPLAFSDGTCPHCRHGIPRPAWRAASTRQTVTAAGRGGRNDVERRANTALRWFEQAQLAGDPLMEVLFCFTALEAILGDTSEGLKAPNWLYGAPC